MATTGRAFSIALAIYAAVCLGIMLAFSWWRTAPWARRFYAPKSFLKGQPKPKHIRSRNPLAWVATTVEAPEPAIERFAGMDGLMYLTFLRFGIQLFLGLSCLALVVALPLNLTGGQVARLMALQASPPPTSQFTYWIATPEPRVQDGGGFSVDSAQPRVVQPPEFYVRGLPAPPAGLEWWEYDADVPLLPQPAEVLGPNYTRFGWRYDASYQEVVYRFSNLDKTTMANVSSGDSRLYGHALLVWASSLWTLWLLYRFNRVALRLRMHHLTNSPPGAASHTILLSDIPGVPFGTVPHRIDNTLLRFLPGSIKSRLLRVARHGFDGLSSQLKLGAGLVASLGPSAASLSRKQQQNAAAGGTVKGQAAGDFTIGAGRFEGSPDLRLGVQAAETAWDQALRQLGDGASIQQLVERQMRSLFGREFDHAFLARDTTRLDPLVAEYEATKGAAEDLLDHYLSLRRRRRDVKPLKITVVPVRFGGWGLERYGTAPLRVNALQHYRDRLVELRRLILEEQEAALNQFTASAFVTFRTHRAQVIAAHSLLHHDPAAWRCHPAPGPHEVVWGNVGWRGWERRGRNLLMWAAFVALALFYMVPVAAVQSLLALNSITAFFQSVPVLAALVTAVLPGLVLKLFLKLLPAILGLMQRFAGAVSESEVDLGVVSWLFIFQVITVFFGSFVAGSFANQIKQFIHSPGSIITILGTAAPQTAIFFTTYLMLQALLAKPLSLLRLPGLVIFWLQSRLAATERAKARIWQNREQTYGGLIPDDSIALLLGLVFSLICPVIAPMALLYFLVVYVVQKYQLLYISAAKYQSGGQAWTRIFTQVCFSLGLCQATMVGILGVKRAVVPPLIVLPLLPLTAGFYLWCRALFWRPQQTLALADAARLDEQEAGQGRQQSGPTAEEGQGQQEGGEGETAPPSAGCSAGEAASQLYLSPAFRLDLGQAFGALLFEADVMLRYLSTGLSSEEAEAIQARVTATVEAAYVTAEEEEAAGAAAAGECSWLDGPGDGRSSESPAAGGHGSEQAGQEGSQGAETPVVMVHNPVAGDSRCPSSSGGGGDSPAASEREAASVGPLRKRAGRLSVSVDVEAGGRR